MATVIVDGKEIEIGDEERLNGIQIAARAGIDVPHYCWHAGLSVVASCRMCLVETGQRNAETGEISMMPKLVPACQTPARDGTVFVTGSEKVTRARAFVEECLLVDHPIDCPICDKAGECRLQDYHFEHGQPERRADIRPFTSRRRDVGKHVTLFVDRCVMCSRCVRFAREVSGTGELMIVSRGAHEEIDVMPDVPLDNKLSGNVVDLCPVGALGDTDFLYQQRVWFMRKHEGVCTGCATGCSIYVEENQDRVYRLKPRENLAVNKWWICDEGRYGFHHVHDLRRLSGAWRGDPKERAPLEWSAAVAAAKQLVESAPRVAALLSPHLTVEAAFLLARWLLQVDPQAILALGPVPVVGQDESFPGDFTIRAERCPNRRGVEEVLQHFAGEVLQASDLLARIEDSPTVVWVTGGYRDAWIEEDYAARLCASGPVIVQDLFPSPISERANLVLPSAAFPEREGSYVNVDGRLQSVAWAIRPPVGARTEESVAWSLAGGSGLYSGRAVLDEVAREIPFFAAAAGPVPAVGVSLVAAEPVEAS